MELFRKRVSQTVICVQTRLFLLVVIGCVLAAGCTDTRVMERPAPSIADAASELAEPSVSVDPAPVMETPPMGGHWAAPRRGVVTAGDIDDALNLSEFRRYQSEAALALGLPKLSPAAAVRVQLLGPDGRPAPGVPVTLRRPDAAAPFYQGHSGVDGWVTAFPAVLGEGTPHRVTLRAFGDGQMQHDLTIKTGTPKRAKLPFGGTWSPDFLDLVFVFDTTGSMSDELDWLTKEFGGIVQAARHAAPGVDIRFGLVAYRDHGDAYVVKNFGFTPRQARMQRWLRSLDADGGGDYPEAAAAALRTAVDLNWRRGNGARLLFHIADAPPHLSDANVYLGAARHAAGRQIKIFGLGASGVAEESEFLMRQAALATAGRYLFLTDDSGVGLSHAEPTIPCYRVTLLRSLLHRVLGAELTGLRKEARPQEVIRNVGTYRNGLCLQ